MACIKRQCTKFVTVKLSVLMQRLPAGSGLLRQQLLHAWVMCYEKYHKRWERNTPGFLMASVCLLLHHSQLRERTIYQEKGSAFSKLDATVMIFSTS